MLLTGVAPACPFFPPSTTDYNWNHIPAPRISQRKKELNERIFSKKKIKKKTFVGNAEQGENNNLWDNSQNSFTASIYYINAHIYVYGLSSVPPLTLSHKRVTQVRKAEGQDRCERRGLREGIMEASSFQLQSQQYATWDWEMKGDSQWCA